MSEVSRTNFIEVNLRANRVPYFNLSKSQEVKKKIISDMKIYNEYLLTTGKLILFFYLKCLTLKNSFISLGLEFESIIIVDRQRDNELITKTLIFNLFNFPLFPITKTFISKLFNFSLFPITKMFMEVTY